MTNATFKCFITNLEPYWMDNRNGYPEYKILVNNKRIHLKYCHYYISTSAYLGQIKHIIYGLLLNGQFERIRDEEKINYLDDDAFKKIIEKAIYPRTPQEKIDNFLTYLHSLQDFEGDTINLPPMDIENSVASSLYFKNKGELFFYLFTLREEGLISGRDISIKESPGLLDIKLTYKGLSKIVELQNEGSKSKKCFVAMSFSENNERILSIRESIKSVLINLDFEPILIDEIHIDSTITINDAIIAEIRKCKFLVADFTEQKHGVYFEAGFALGLNKPVIYLCHEEDFKDSHFDTKHYPHIVYKTMEDLQSKLTSKIEAWII